jgi:hypothetical protein
MYTVCQVNRIARLLDTGNSLTANGILTVKHKGGLRLTTSVQARDI